MFKQVKQGLTLLYLFIYSSSQGQTIYFDKRFDTLGLVDHVKKSFPESYGYSFFYCGNEYTSSPHSTMCLKKVGFDGEDIDTGKCYINDSLFFFNTWTEKDSLGNYYLFGNVTDLRDSFSTGGLGIYKFDNFGSLMFKKHIYNDSMDYYAGMLLLSNSTIFLTGQIHYPNVTGDGILIKLDINGNVIIEKRYGGELYEGLKSLVQTPDGGFMLLGWTRSFGNGQRDYYLVKTDSLGNQEWQKTYGTSANESGWGIIALQDGNFLLGGGGGNFKAALTKIDAFGNLIWQKKYAHPDGDQGNYIYWPKELSDGNIIAVGITTTEAESDAGWLLKTDSEGNELWQQKYNVSTYPDLFYDALPTNDGGFLLSGMCHPNTQDGWLLKVDSLGCPYPNCTVGIEEESKQIAFNLWPNPASNVLNIEIFNRQASSIQLIDATGRTVLTAALNSGSNAIDVGSLAKGLYTVQVQSSSGVITKKLVVE